MGGELGPVMGPMLVLVKYVYFVINYMSVVVYVNCCKNKTCEFWSHE